MRTPLLRRRSNSGSAALIIVMAFLVIVTGIVLAFFGRTMSNAQISSNGSNQSRVDLFSQGALNMILGDLQQEIAAGSTSTTYSTNSGGTVYTPTNNFTASPYPTGGNAAALPGTLVKYSSRSQPFYASQGSYVYNTGSYPAPTLAAAISTTNNSLNGRAISAARWNQSLLLPKNKPGGTDTTPTSAFTPPDWVLMARDGSRPASWNAGMISGVGDVTNTTAVVGRYAYAIYDEGSLLDVNVAGYPSSLTNSTYAVQRSGLSFADLTVPLVQAGLTQAQATKISDQIVGWRNQVSARPSGNFPAFTFDTAATNYFGSVFSNPMGFLTTATTNSSGSSSDRLFTSRRQLIQFMLDQTNNGPNAAALQSTLQYLGTFTRDLNQPSYTPNPNRPKIANAASAGGNDYFGKDVLSNPAQSVNPPFLAIRAATGFARNDGSTAIVGEPLVKKRFALNRLAWITYNGPSATRSLNDVDMKSLQNYGISVAWLQKGTAAAVQSYFGLKWNTGGYWTYSPPEGSGNPIATLSQVAGDKREANFFELLKAATLAGSIGKDFPNDIADATDHHFTSGDSSIMQIGANIIAQATVDGYPPRIDFNVGNGVVSAFGVKNLPGFYRIRTTALLTRKPTATGVAGGGTICPSPALTTQFPGATLTDAGEVTAMQQPEIWNPHAWNPGDVDGSLGNPRPTAFKLVATAAAPITVTGWDSQNGNTVGAATAVSLNSTLTFSIPASSQGAGLFREPTLLITPNIPTGSSLAGSTTTGTGSSVSAYGAPMAYGNPAQYPTGVSDVGSTGTNPFVGFIVGKNPAVFSYGTGINNYIQLAFTNTLLPGASPQNTCGDAITYSLYFQDINGNWQPYDTKTGYTIPHLTARLRWPNWGAASLFADSPFTDLTTKQPGSYLDSLVGYGATASVFDPRTGRFGLTLNEGVANLSDQYSPAPRHNPWFNVIWRWVCPQQNVIESERPDNRAGYMLMTSATSAAPPQAGSGWLWTTSLFHGLAAQNQVTAQGDTMFANNDPAALGTSQSQYYADPDNVIRRGSAAYLAPGASTTIGQPLAISTSYTSAGVGTPILGSGTTVPSGTMISATNDYNGAAPANLTSTTGTMNSRPVVLNRPFRSVAELGYVFSGTPWRNLDMSTPESGFAAYLDVFCIQDTDSTNALVAGKINPNTRQLPVLQAVLSQTYEDAYGNFTPISSTLAKAIAQQLQTRTTGTATGVGPIGNLSELVGKSLFTSPQAGTTLDGSQSTYFSGFSADLSSVAGVDANFTNIARFREAAIRPLAAAGTTRVWNLFIDLVAQMGKYPSTATALDKFLVEGEQRYWIHVAIDRLTGQVLDMNVEVVNE